MSARQQAIDWFVRRRSISADTTGAFDAWLNAAPENAQAYAEVEETWGAAGEVAEHPAVEAWRAEVEGGLGARRYGRRAIAAGLAAAVIGVGGWGAYGLITPRSLADQSFRTAVGQQATVTLPDGSVVTLNTDTVVRTRADKHRRLIYLDRGQAFFKVAKDRRHPFVVAAAGRTVTALGTAFDVRVDRGGLKVVLVEGKVRVETIDSKEPSPGPSSQASLPEPAVATEMGPGTQLVAPAGADWRVARANVARETSWLNGQIVISNEPLGQAIEELNRYSQRKIVLDDPGLADTRVSGVFRPGDLEGFARALRTSGMAQVRQETETEYRIVAMK